MLWYNVSPYCTLLIVSVKNLYHTGHINITTFFNQNFIYGLMFGASLSLLWCSIWSYASAKRRRKSFTGQFFSFSENKLFVSNNCYTFKIVHAMSLASTLIRNTLDSSPSLQDTIVPGGFVVCWYYLMMFLQIWLVLTILYFLDTNGSCCPDRCALNGKRQFTVVEHHFQA